MTEGFLGEIRMLPIQYTPQKWTPCYGQLMTITGYEDLYSVVGTAYGGDGRTNFGVPDLRGRIPMHRGTGLGLTPRLQGQMFGVEGVTLDIDQIPNHNHELMANSGAATNELPTNNVFCKTTYTSYGEYVSNRMGQFNDAFLLPTGSGGEHSNLMRFAVVPFFMCIKGVYPKRS
ncbi:phage tail protein [Endothiovibrio diazotrophicus]